MQDRAPNDDESRSWCGVPEPDWMRENHMDTAPPLITLDEIGILAGTDKNFFVNDYLRHYDLIFTPLRHAEFNLIEIGVFDGNSMTMWSRYFSKARIIGVDVNPACKQYENERVTIEIGSVENPEFLTDVVARFPPTIIIDDGSHRADHQIFTFERLFPALKSGGIYIVEDLHFQLTEPDAGRLRGEASISSVEYFQKIVASRLASRHQQRQFHGLEAYFASAIETIQVVQQALIMRKARKAADLEAELARLRPLVEESGHFRNWLHFALRLQDLGRSPEAVEAMRRSVAAKPDEAASRQYLSNMLERQGDIPGAITALEPLLTVLRGRSDILKRVDERLGELRRRL
jgi:hypothetical protein